MFDLNRAVSLFQAGYFAASFAKKVKVLSKDRMMLGKIYTNKLYSKAKYSSKIGLFLQINEFDGESTSKYNKFIALMYYVVAVE